MPMYRSPFATTRHLADNHTSAFSSIDRPQVMSLIATDVLVMPAWTGLEMTLLVSAATAVLERRRRRQPSPMHLSPPRRMEAITSATTISMLKATCAQLMEERDVLAKDNARLRAKIAALEASRSSCSKGASEQDVSKS
ncbi:hypothetical protein AMAG_14689 [Allomyces macrogynus ATCC 38327]|uniref:Uncharacterized protein n=1 Tax=Allomyces macrogynus (strain ATCC 38327) TaxID=578462 RepID=A0A0L0T748_ALLM3|nr:hypothetical protein AMAG_14689 [Allomyces macrogynus ATCC 38327]|eukprot:KNE70567.1 hypothetical protein AMAG_14689 [Allomyces macrogynus ATCC 38327]